MSTDSLLKENNFTFMNGDLYKGQYTYDETSKRLVREGQGTYTKTCSCQLYRGKWQKDKLIEKVEIEFARNQCYRGLLTPTNDSKQKIDQLEYDEGTFHFGDMTSITGDFTTPQSLSFIDGNGNMWPMSFQDDKITLTNSPSADVSSESPST